MEHERAAIVMRQCAELGAISVEAQMLTRPSFTHAMRQVHAQVAEWMYAIGMTVREDAMGNLIGRYAAEQPDAPTFIIGSHLDTVRNAGNYDGVLGVLIGLAAVATLYQQGRRLPFALEVVAFTDEEGLRFGAALLGSRAMAGSLDPALLARTDADGISIATALRAFGGDPQHLASAVRDPATLCGYCEIHIEQGPQLEAKGLPVGVVSAITGITRANAHFHGVAGHAGTVPMHLRHDALCAAAAFILAAETLARNTDGLTITVGQLTVTPGASNVIPSIADVSIDLRHHNDHTRIEAAMLLRDKAKAIAKARQVRLTWDDIQQIDAVPMDRELRRHLAAAIAAEGITPFELASGAGHDAMVIGTITPAAMLFVRCVDGISHNPAEAVALADVATSIAVVNRFLQSVAAA
jgi:allantoate deiminase